jgi:hypothetical protein
MHDEPLITKISQWSKELKNKIEVCSQKFWDTSKSNSIINRISTQSTTDDDGC